jgi:hypothetical protein
MPAHSTQELDVLDWLKRAEPTEVHARFEAAWEETSEYEDSFAALLEFAEEDPYYDDVTLANPQRDGEVIEYLRSTAAETLFEQLNETLADAEGKSAYLQIVELLDSGA